MQDPDEDTIQLLPRFACCLVGHEVGPEETVGRLIVHLALEGGGLSRQAAGARLWPDLDTANSAKRLRQLLWRLRPETRSMIVIGTDSLRLADDVTVDYHAAKSLAQHILHIAPATLHDVDPLIVRLLSTELLRDGYDEEVLNERGRWDRLRLLALERLATTALEIGDTENAVVLATLAAQVDDLAETPPRVLVQAHLRRGDTVTAYRTYLDYAAVVRRELGVEPGPALRELVSGLHLPAPSGPRP
ncbi:BTAD domain-containing putative transcriptional regulator [Actinomadura sp. 1N219]|uniref:AfsR/SARP family transcriptional regulator n=1 Tax=Actinomadura sp. 1N219 TaxID=3375152 RepID=UPI00378F1A43